MKSEESQSYTSNIFRARTDLKQRIKYVPKYPSPLKRNERSFSYEDRRKQKNFSNNMDQRYEWNKERPKSNQGVSTKQMLIRQDLPPKVSPPGFSTGEWVRSRYHPYKKGYGYYYCHNCNRGWLSAYSKKGYTQGCEKCPRKYYAEWMWLFNEEENTLPKILDERIPHKIFLCEACKRGKCPYQKNKRRKRNYYTDRGE